MDIYLLLEKFRFVSPEQQENYLSEFEKSPQNRELLLDWMSDAVEDLNLNIDDSDDILTGFYLLAHLKEQRAFPIIRSLMNEDIENVEEYLEDFILSDAPCLMACFLDQGEALYEIIENPLINRLWKMAALEALVQLIGIDSLSRTTAMHFLKNLLRTLLESSSDNELLSHVIATCCMLHPKEVAEEIREAFARDIVDPFLCTIEDFHADLVIPLSAMQEFLQEDALAKLTPLETLQAYYGEPEADFEEEPGEPIEMIGRNDPCPCGSGKKYKKCCMFSQAEQSQKIRFVNMKITSEPIKNETYPYTVSEEDEKLLGELYSQKEIKNNPEQSLKPLLSLKEKYPNYPALYNYIYACYKMLDQEEKALDILKETLKLFPRYLFALLEYGQHLLQCKEYDQFLPLFNHSYNLVDLYPERDTFHMAEVKYFSYVMGKYFAKTGDLRQAAVYLDCLKQICPDEEETQLLEDLISYSLL